MLGFIFNLVSSLFRFAGNVAYKVLGALGIRGMLWNLFTYILTHHRTWLVVFVVLPMSFVFDLYWRGRTWYIAKIKSSPHKHHERVAAIQERVGEWARQGKKVRMCTARPGWMTVSPRHALYKKTLFTVECELSDILELDTKKRILRVEPSVNVLQLLDYLLPRGYTLPMIPELDELTVGGLINGYGIETSSHHTGLFNDLAVAYEIVVPSGEVLRVTPADKLFHAIPWSYGTLGFLTAVELRVIPATKYPFLFYLHVISLSLLLASRTPFPHPRFTLTLNTYVRHKYIPVYSTEAMVKKWTELQTAGPDSPDFLEGFMYSKTEGKYLFQKMKEREGKEKGE
jgi:hypothetical protein